MTELSEKEKEAIVKWREFKHWRDVADKATVRANLAEEQWQAAIRGEPKDM